MGVVFSLPIELATIFSYTIKLITVFTYSCVHTILQPFTTVDITQYCIQAIVSCELAFQKQDHLLVKVPKIVCISVAIKVHLL